MNRSTRHDKTNSPNTDMRPQAAHSIRHPASLIRQRVHATLTAAGILGTAAVAAVLFGSSHTASAAPAQSARDAAGSPADSMLKATFTSTAVSVTPNLGMVELILSGNGTVQGFGSATEVIGVVEDRTVSPCGARGASDSAQRRMVMTGGVLVLHESAMLCVTASGPQVTGTYRVDGQASTGIFAGARGTGRVTADVTTGHETVSGTLILIPRAG